MNKADSLFKATNLLSYFEQLKETTKVNATYSYNDAEHIFEVHVEERSDELESRLESVLEIYKPDISVEETNKGKTYYRIAVPGLMQDLED